MNGRPTEQWALMPLERRRRQTPVRSFQAAVRVLRPFEAERTALSAHKPRPARSACPKFSLAPQEEGYRGRSRAPLTR
jgi:hypothetical protein